MASKEAGIKLTLTAAGFSSGLKGAEKETAAAGGRMGKALSKGLSDGVKEGVDSLKAKVSSIKSGVASLAGVTGVIGAGAGFAEMVKGAMAVEGQMKKFAYAVKAGSGEALNFRDVQKEVQATAVATGQSAEELGTVLAESFRATGDSKFARESLKAIAVAATATREPIETMGKLGAELGDKFGIGSGEIGDALATAYASAQKGGVTLEDMAEKMGQIGANAKEAGLTGTEGFKKMIALMNVSDDAMGNMRKGLPAVAGLLDQLGTKAERNKTMMKLGIVGGGKGDVTQTIGEILKKTGGNKDKLAVAFAGPQLQFLTELGSKYAQTFKETGGSVKDKTAAALAAYEDALKGASTTHKSFSEMEKDAEGARPIQKAMERIKEAFSNPEFTTAIVRLMNLMPKLAEVIAGVVDFASEHPYAAAGIGAGAMVGKEVLGGVASAGIKSLFAGAGRAVAVEAVAGMAGTAAASAGGGIAASFVGALVSGPGLIAIGVAIAAAFAAKAIADASAEREKMKEDAADKGEQQLAGEQGGSGNGADSGSAFMDRDENGRWKRFTPGDFDSPAAFDARKEELFAKRKAAADEHNNGWEPGFAGVPYSQDQGFSFLEDNGGRAATKAPTAQAAGFNAEQTALLAQMLGGLKGELKVRVINASDIGGAGGSGGTGGPRPGHAAGKGK